MISMSRIGLTSPSTWMTSASSKAPVPTMRQPESTRGGRALRGLTDDLEDTVDGTDVCQEVVA